MAKKSKKNRVGVVYSTSDDFEYDMIGEDDVFTPDPNNQLLRVSIDRKGRKGKAVVLIKGFEGAIEDRKDLEKKLKSSCGVGGSSNDEEIIIQGDKRDKVLELLGKWGYKTKRVGG